MLKCSPWEQLIVRMFCACWRCTSCRILPTRAATEPRCVTVLSQFANVTLRALCPRRPASTKPTRRCSSTVSRTFPVVNNTTSGLRPWQQRAEATSAQRSQWSLLGKVGPPGEPVAEQTGGEVFVEVAGRAPLRWLWNGNIRSLSSLSLRLAQSAPSVIDWQP